jgi:hypothetical protein
MILKKIKIMEKIRLILYKLKFKKIVQVVKQELNQIEHLF